MKKLNRSGRVLLESSGLYAQLGYEEYSACVDIANVPTVQYRLFSTDCPVPTVVGRKLGE